MLSLEQLRKLCRQTLVLTTATTPDREDLPNAAVLLAGLDEFERNKLNYPTQYPKRGLDNEFLPERGYANWVWLPTPCCVRSMLSLAGFAVQEFYPALHVTTVVAAPAKAPFWGPDM